MYFINLGPSEVCYCTDKIPLLHVHTFDLLMTVNVQLHESVVHAWNELVLDFWSQLLGLATNNGML